MARGRICAAARPITSREPEIVQGRRGAVTKLIGFAGRAADRLRGHGKRAVALPDRPIRIVIGFGPGRPRRHHHAAGRAEAAERTGPAGRDREPAGRRRRRGGERGDVGRSPTATRCSCSPAASRSASRCSRRMPFDPVTAFHAGLDAWPSSTCCCWSRPTRRCARSRTCSTRRAPIRGQFNVGTINPGSTQNCHGRAPAIGDRGQR